MSAMDHQNSCPKPVQTEVKICAWKERLHQTLLQVFGDPHHGRRVVMGISATIMGLATLEGLYLFDSGGYNLFSLVGTVSGTLAAIAYLVCPSEHCLKRSAAVVAASAILVATSMVGITYGTRILTSVSLALLWSSLFELSRAFHISAFLGSLVSMWIFGARFTLVATPQRELHSISALEALCFIAIPYGLGRLLQFYEKRRLQQLELEFVALHEERNRLEAQYRQKSEQLDQSRHALIEAERHETTSRIAGGLAHELNNILTPIHGLAELMAKNPRSLRNEKYAHSILSSAQSASMLTHALLTYTRKGEFHPQAHFAGAMMEKLVLPEIRGIVPANVSVICDFDPSIVIEADHYLWKQCVWHLVRNGIEAMPEGGQLFLSLKAGRSHSQMPSPPLDQGVSHPLKPSQNWVCLTVRDTGKGIARENLNRVFDPFFTTKTFGVGAGIGLALVEGAIAQHRGHVDLESRVGQGTSVHLWVPRSHSSPKVSTYEDGESSAGVHCLLHTRPSLGATQPGSRQLE